MLILFCGCCEVQLVSYVHPPTPPSRAESMSTMARNSFAKLVRTVCEVEEEEESLLGIILSVSCVVTLSIILLFSNYLTRVFSCHLFKHVCVLQHSCFQSVCEIAAAGKRNTSSWFKSCMGHPFFFLNTTLTCNGSSIREAINKMKSTLRK